MDQQYRVLNEQILPQLEAEGIRLLFRHHWTEAVRAWAQRHFEETVLPVLTPVGLDPAHPFPTVINKSLNFMVTLRGRDAFGRSSRSAVVQAPRLLDRILPVPPEVSGREHDFVTLSGVIHENVGQLFPGMDVTGCFQFRVTRNSDLWVDEEEVDDLLRALKGELLRRNFGDGVRLEVNRDCPEDVWRFLLRKFELGEQDLYTVDGPVNMHRLLTLYDLVARPDLKYRRFVPSTQADVAAADDLFAVIRARDVLLHHPFESFGPVVNFVKQAARDPAVLALKVTMYRTGTASPVTDALIEAARNGKEVTAVVELRARFDEEANIDIATRLQDAGVRVVYGVVGYKAHAKMILVVRREGDGVRRYVHLGTGNYHMRTTRQYTDIGLLTCRRDIGADVHLIFQLLTGLGRTKHLEKLLQSPFSLNARLLELIEAEIGHVRAGRPGSIQAKCNALVDARIIAALYRASRAGVTVELIVRGPCALRPGIPGVSDTIRVRSIIGRFLEHTRIYHFGGGGDPVTLCSSADLMPRNLHHRVEVAFPVEEPALRERVLAEGLSPYLADNTQAWELRADGSYARARPEEDAAPFAAQIELLRRLARYGG